MQTKNAINKVTKKGYEITEEKGFYTFVINGCDYSFVDQDGTAMLFSTHFEGAVHPEFFKNLTQLLKFAEAETEEIAKEAEDKIEKIEVKEIKEVTEVPEITEVIENSVLETDSYKLVRENDGHKFYAKAFDSREEARFNSKYDYQAQIFQDGKWFNYSNYGYSEDYSTHPDETEETENTNAITVPEDEIKTKNSEMKYEVNSEIKYHIVVYFAGSKIKIDLDEDQKNIKQDQVVDLLVEYFQAVRLFDSPDEVMFFSDDWFYDYSRWSAIAAVSWKSEYSSIHKDFQIDGTRITEDKEVIKEIVKYFCNLD